MWWCWVVGVGVVLGVVGVVGFGFVWGFWVLFKLGLPWAFALGLFVNKIGEGGN